MGSIPCRQFSLYPSLSPAFAQLYDYVLHITALESDVFNIGFKNQSTGLL